MPSATGRRGSTNRRHQLYAEYTQDGKTFAADGERAFTFTVRRDRAEMRLEGDVGEMHLRRPPKLPALGGIPGPTGPLAAFDQFWTAFAENYPFFAAKGIDWNVFTPTELASGRDSAFAAAIGYLRR